MFSLDQWVLAIEQNWVQEVCNSEKGSNYEMMALYLIGKIRYNTNL